MRPEQRLTIDVFLQDTFAQHQAEGFARTPPWGIRGLVDDVPQVVQAAGLRRLAGLLPGFA